MKKFLYKKAFLRSFDRFKESEKELAVQADGQIQKYYLNGDAPYGLRIKKLFEKGTAKTFEARVTDKIRILFVESEEIIAFAFIGNHEQARRYIKTFR